MDFPLLIFAIEEVKTCSCNWCLKSVLKLKYLHQISASKFKYKHLPGVVFEYY